MQIFFKQYIVLEVEELKILKNEEKNKSWQIQIENLSREGAGMVVLVTQILAGHLYLSHPCAVF